MNTFGDRLRAARTAQGLTQDELAAFVGVSKSAVSSWENNRDTPGFDKLPLLRKFLKATLDDLVCGDREPREFQPALPIKEDAGTYDVSTSDLLAREECRLVQRFRAMSEKKRRALLIVIDA